jgi:hypothetical protein
MTRGIWAAVALALGLMPAAALADAPAPCSPAPVEICVLPTVSLLPITAGPIYIGGPNSFCFALPFGPPCPPKS